MEPEQLVFMIPILGIMLGFFATWTKHREKIEERRIEATASQSAEKAAQYASQIQRLEDRVQVLERIVTDRGYDVATQIEALRDTRSVEDSEARVPLEVARKEAH